MYGKADKVIPNSKGIKFDLIKNFNIEESKIQVINNPIDIKKISKLQNDNIKFKLNNKFTFITIGSLHQQKNHNLLIEAFLALNCKKCQLLIIGEGELKDRLQKKIDTLNLSNQVFLLGNKKNPYKYLKNADCFVFSSDYEGFPNVLLEALACEIAIISTDCQSGPREILAPEISYTIENKIEFAKFGILVPVNNIQYLTEAMKIVKEDRKVFERYSKNLLVRAEVFNINAISQQYINLIENISK